MNNEENSFGKNIAKLIITSASIFMGWSDSKRDVILNDVAKDVSSRVLREGELRNRSNSKNRNRNRSRRNRGKKQQPQSV